MRQLLQSISSDPQLKQSKDSILLAEDQYPIRCHFHKVVYTNHFTKYHHTITVGQEIKRHRVRRSSITINSQNYMRTTYQFTPTSDSPWDTYFFRQWKYFVTNLCLSAVQEALKTGDNAKGVQHLFASERTDKTVGATHNTRNTVQGMLLYHPLLLESPWQAPDDLDA